MSTARPFREVKLQWLQQLSCDRELGDSARSIALYIITTHVNGHTEKAWPSYQTIAEATGKSVKSIQRAVRELEVSGWFEVRRGNGVGHNTEYRPSAASIIRATEAREKTDKIVPLRPREGGQNRPVRGSDMSSEGGQICPPNLEKEKIYKSNAREGAPPRKEAQRAIPLVFLDERKAKQISLWRAWLHRYGLPSLEAVRARTMRGGRFGYDLPGYWPPDDGDVATLDWIAFFQRCGSSGCTKAFETIELLEAS
ncbi:helix-turn-helix domain-containing protein [Neorhizobium sp. JUb45]|uniref:helix-turn-helix domain-containing protein n=1 Tax=Neorhizobium sp. JUb45 TaxID=2485113 RepID=UPI00104A8AD4|nr:helix-turn-helix domain-containing protein [Neorhizobium sp. JUb45]TCR03933.1 helix-turn-helix protein [Neorhizobium sp. JUb45]